jgi:hypothetical protein
MNVSEAIVIGLLTGSRQNVAWAAVPGAGWRAIARLAIAIAVIGVGAAALDMAARTAGDSGWVATGPEAGRVTRQ